MPAPREAAPLNVSEVHEKHADFVWRSLQRLGVRSADLEDLLQEVFIVVHRRLESFDGSARLTTWLFGICVRVASGYRNRAHVRRERSGTEPELFDAIPQEPAQGAANPEQALLDKELREELEELLDGLDPVKRAMVVMFEIEGMSAPEIATLTDVPVNTVYSRLATARAELTAAARRAQLRRQRGGRAKVIRE